MFRVFFDANVIFATCISLTGASFELVRLAQTQQLELVTCNHAFVEVETNLQLKKPDQIKTLAQLRTQPYWHIVNADLQEIRNAYAYVTDPFDAPIIAAAKKAAVDVLVSFDRKHLHNQAVEQFINAPVLIAGETLILYRQKNSIL